MERFAMRVLELIVLASVTTCIGRERLIVILEREAITYCDENYAIVHDHSLSRANRTSPYTYKINGTILHPWYNNVTVEIIGFENHNNEYRESVIHFTYQICDLFERPNFVLKIARNFGNIPVKCPMEKNLHIENLSVRDDQIPPYFPQAKWMLQLQAYTTKHKVKIIEAQLYFQITSVVVRNSNKRKKSKH